MEDMDPEPLLLENFSDMNNQRVNGSFCAPFDEEANEVEQLLAEPKSDNISVDAVLCYGENSSRKYFEMEDFSCGFEYGFAETYGGLESCNTLEGGYDLRLGNVLDGILDDVDEVDDFDATHDLSTACGSFLFDMEFAEKLTDVDCGLYQRSKVGDTSSESRFPLLSGSSTGTTEIEESLAETTTVSQSKNDTPPTSRSKYGWQGPDSTSPSSTDMGNLYDLDEDEQPLVSFILSSKKGNKNCVRARNVDRQKRLCKPTRRYIEEFSELKSSRYIPSGEKVHNFASNDYFTESRSHDEHHIKAPKLVSRLESFSGGGSQRPSETRVLRRCPKQSPLKLDFESSDVHIESGSESETEDEDEHVIAKRSKKGGDRRKHQRMWTLTEVLKLMDGISEYGVGRWTHIKRLLFSSAAYRTPIDLRDKWRNLLKATANQHNEKHNRREATDKLKHGTRTVPKHVLRRIKELAAIHPYPKKSNSKMSHVVDHLASPALPVAARGASFSPHGRSLRRKNT